MVFESGWATGFLIPLPHADAVVSLPALQRRPPQRVKVRTMGVLGSLGESRGHVCIYVCMHVLLSKLACMWCCRGLLFFIARSSKRLFCCAWGRGRRGER
jgi:hypothetical protein